MYKIKYLVWMLVAAVLPWSSYAQDIKIDKQTVKHVVDVSIDATVSSWSIAPANETVVKTTGPKTASLELPPGSYVLTAWLSATTGRSLRVTVGVVPEPTPGALIEVFAITPETIKKGESATLSWKTKAKNVKLNGIDVLTSGTQKLVPDITTTYTLVAVDGDKTETAQRILTVTDTPPPPTPGPLTVLMIENVEKRNLLTPEQLVILMGAEVRTYLDNNCKKDAKGRPEWLLIDDLVLLDTQEAKNVYAMLDKVWQDGVLKVKEEMTKNANLKVPLVMVSNGVQGEIALLPKNKDEILALFKKYRGQ